MPRSISARLKQGCTLIKVQPCKKKMRLLVISNLYPPHIIGGYEIACQDFCEGLARLGHQIEIMTSNYGLSNRSNLPDSPGANGGQVIKRLLNFNDSQKAKDRFLKKWLGIKSVYFDLINFLVTFYEILRFKPDVVYIWNLAFVSLSPIIGAVILKKKIVFHLEDYWLGAALRFNQNRNQGVIEETLKFILNFLLRRTIVKTPFIALSEYIQKYYLNQGMRGRNSVIYNGLSELLFIRNPQPVTRNPKTLLYGGRLIFDKGVHLILEAMNILQNEGLTDVSLDLVGAGEEDYLHYLKNLIQKYGLEKRVNFLGLKTHEETMALYPIYSIIVVPSVWEEPFGLMVIEAMARGCVPIVSNSGALPEIVKDGKSGLVFRKGEVSDLAEKIKQLLVNQSVLEQLGANAVADIKDRFDLESKTKEVEKFLFGF